MTLFSLSGLLIAITSLFFGVLVFIKNEKTKLNQIWLFFSLAIAIWGIGGYKIGLTTNPASSLFWWRLTHIGVIFIPIFFLHFVYKFLNILNKKRLIILSGAYCLGVFFLITDLFTKLFIANVRWVFNSFYFDSPPTPLYWYFVFFWVGLVIYAHYELFRAFQKREISETKRVQIRYFFLATLLGFSGGATSFLPVFGIDFYPIFNFAVPLHAIIMAYAILKYHLLDITIITVEIIAAMALFVSAVQILVSQSSASSILGFIFFVTFLIFTILLIRSINQEIQRREEVQRLAEKLTKATQQLTTANTRLKQLDQTKSDFISIASHQLRTPLTAIKGFTSMVLEGFWNGQPAKQKEALEKVYTNTQKLINLVETLLSVSRLESGRMIFNFELTSLEELVQGIISDIKNLAKAKKIKLSFRRPLHPLPMIKLDPLTIRQVILNFIDNAIYYTNHGAIKIHLAKKENSIIFSVIDAGIGFTPAQKLLFFQKFSRAQTNSNIHSNGTGLGLYAAAKIIEAHHGRIGAESPGENKGSTFWFSLPINI